VTPIGVLAVITFKDIPEVGQNIGYITMFGTGLLFADEVTISAGQIIALVVSPILIHSQSIHHRNNSCISIIFLVFLLTLSPFFMTYQVADTQKHADMAAHLAVVEYDSRNIGTPVLSVEDAVKRSSLFEVPPEYQPEPVGDISKGMAEADRKIRSVEVLKFSSLS